MELVTDQTVNRRGFVAFFSNPNGDLSTHCTCMLAKILRLDPEFLRFAGVPEHTQGYANLK